ncbi:MAG: methanol/ethanol family PQQ-dependent dehydrogenase [Geminicoccaceae bacterium]
MKKPLHTAVALAALGLGLPSLAHANDELLFRQNNPAEWVMPNGNYSSQRYSALTQINRENVSGLQPQWTFSTGVLRGHEGGPLVIGNVMYIHTPFPNIVYALDLDDEGRVLWKYQPVQDPNVIPIMCCDTVNRGVAYGDGKIFLSQADTTLVALDAKTGQVVWQVKNGDPSIGETATAAPLVYKDKVYIGVSGGEFGVRGRLTAYKTSDGSVAWKGWSMGPDSDTLMDPDNTTHLGKPVGKDSGTNTWEGDQWKIGGGTTWGWYSVDPELNLVYYGTGNPSTWNPVQRPGDNRWSMTIFARDADTGMAKWVYQMTPHDEWDYDGINEMILADIPVKGQDTKALVHFDRNGFAYTMDRTNGALLVAEKYDPAVNWATHVDMETGRPQVVPRYSTDHNGEDVNTTNICPAALGSKDQQPASFSHVTGLFYVPTNHVCMDYEPYQVSYTAGQPYVGSTVSMYPGPGGNDLGAFTAWDAGTGKIVWRNPEPFSVWSGALSTAGNVVFYGTLEGYLKAVDAETGRELFRFKTPSGIIGNVNTWMHKGKQYVGVLSGIGGWAGIGLAAGLIQEENAAAWHGAVDQGKKGDADKVVDTAGLGAVGAYKTLSSYTNLGGQLTVFALPN